VTVVIDTAEYQIVRTTNDNGYTDTLIPKPGTVTANQAAIASNVAGALARLRQIQAQAATFAGQAPYGAATLANLNDLLAKTQLIAQAVNDIAADLIGLCRIISNNYDGTG
jgi:hypothetical protein